MHSWPDCQASLHLLQPLGEVTPLARALGFEVTDILANPAPRPASTGATHLLLRVRDVPR